MEVTLVGVGLGNPTTLTAAAAAAPWRPVAEIRSITASAWVRPMRPFKKARLVNSPGPAGAAWGIFFSRSSKPWPVCREPDALR